ncbi:ATP-dependent zinc metalloprotease FtsH 1 [Frankliniella fusca]|uniref:ATP-dependent zinc metalloprotease FtsH 1 n=1 Tax=Frankliniella fusca TaxID=407009 RepID=A0AAE1H7E7_9NEOP|nr:ATP-dependent zinc metalloprotease FtsH 1 [Frankliniella fusca]
MATDSSEEVLQKALRRWYRFSYSSTSAWACSVSSQSSTSRTVSPATVPASFVAWRWASLKYAGTVTTASVTLVPRKVCAMSFMCASTMALTSTGDSLRVRPRSCTSIIGAPFWFTTCRPGVRRSAEGARSPQAHTMEVTPAAQSDVQQSSTSSQESQSSKEVRVEGNSVVESSSTVQRSVQQSVTQRVMSSSVVKQSSFSSTSVSSSQQVTSEEMEMLQ